MSSHLVPGTGRTRQAGLPCLAELCRALPSVGLVRLLARRGRSLAARLCPRLRDAGMTTAEYAVGTVAACGFAALLYKILTGGAVSGLLQALVRKALGSA